MSLCRRPSDPCRPTLRAISSSPSGEPEKALRLRLATTPEGAPQNNIVTNAHTVRVANVREAEEAFTLDVHGFEIVGHKTAVRDFWDEAQTLALGHPETAELVRRVTGAARVVVFDHTLRRRLEGTNDRHSRRRPPASGSRPRRPDGEIRSRSEVRDLLGDQAEGLPRPQNRDPHQCLAADRPFRRVTGRSPWPTRAAWRAMTSSPPT